MMMGVQCGDHRSQLIQKAMLDLPVAQLTIRVEFFKQRDRPAAHRQ